MVMPACVLVLPTVIASGTAVPDGAPAGICKFTCMAPETRPGADPAYKTVAGTETPPIVAVTARIGFLSRLPSKGVTVPSVPIGDVCPSPVMKTDTTEPLGAGVAGPLMEPSRLTVAPGPVPDWLSEKIPGEVATTLNEVAADSTPKNSTWTLVDVRLATP